MKPARLVLANLHATSRPVLVVPWLLAQCHLRRVDAVLLQECTPRHARWLRRAPGWTLIRDRGPAGEAILARRRHYSEATIKAPASPGWRGKHTGQLHPGRVLPSALIRGWLRATSIHFPPGWLDGPEDRQAAGEIYIARLSRLVYPVRGAAFYGGDWNARPNEFGGWRRSALTIVGPDSIDHAGVVGCTVRRFKSIGRGPGMDHAAWFYVVDQAPRA